MRQRPSPARELGAGATAALPLAVGLVPFMIVYGVLMHTAGYAPLVAQAMSVLVFAGSQLVAAQLLLGGAPIALIVATSSLMSLRYALYSAALAPSLRQLSWPWRLLLAYVLTDETYLLAMRRAEQQEAPLHLQWFVLGAGLDIWLAVQGGTALGSLLGSQAPAAWHLEFAAPLTFLALLLSSARKHASRGAALVAGVGALVTMGLPFHLGLLVATGLGMLAGLVLETRAAGPREEQTG